MISNIKEFIMRRVRKYLWEWYYEEFKQLVNDSLEKQYANLMDSIEIAQDQGTPIIMMIHPQTAIGLAEFATKDIASLIGEEIETKEKKDNPFKLVEDDE